MRRARRAAALAGVLALALGGPVAAQSEDLLECTTQAVTPAFRDKLADAMLASDDAADPLFEQLATVSDECAGRHGLAADKGESYFAYSVARLPRDAFITRLGAAGLSAQVIDDALDFGPGRSNPVISGTLDRAQVDTILAALRTAGVDVDQVSDSNWAMVGAYAAASSLMWQNLAKLR